MALVCAAMSDRIAWNSSERRAGFRQSPFQCDLRDLERLSWNPRKLKPPIMTTATMPITHRLSGFAQLVNWCRYSFTRVHPIELRLPEIGGRINSRSDMNRQVVGRTMLRNAPRSSAVEPLVDPPRCPPRSRGDVSSPAVGAISERLGPVERRLMPRLVAKIRFIG